MSGVHAEQYMRVLLALLRLTEKADAAVSPELFWLSVVGLSKITQNPEKLFKALGLSQPLDYVSYLNRWACVSQHTLQFAGFVLGSSDVGLVPNSLRNFVTIGAMTEENLAKAIENVSRLDVKVPEIDLGMNLAMYFAVSFSGTWKNAATPQEVSFCGKKVRGFEMTHEFYPYKPTDNCLYVAMPMHDGTFAVYAMPNPDAESRCSRQEILDTVMKYREWECRSFTVKAPDAKIQSEIDLADKFNIKGLFTTYGILNEFKMNTSLDVDYTGIRASSSVEVLIGKGRGPRTVEVDKPYFLFVIDGCTGKVMFQATHGHLGDSLEAGDNVDLFKTPSPQLTLLADANENQVFDKMRDDAVKACSDNRHDFGDTCPWQIEVSVKTIKNKDDTNFIPIPVKACSQNSRKYEVHGVLVYVGIKNVGGEAIDFIPAYHEEEDGYAYEELESLAPGKFYEFPFPAGSTDNEADGSESVVFCDAKGIDKLKISFHHPGTVKSEPEKGGPQQGPADIATGMAEEDAAFMAEVLASSLPPYETEREAEREAEPESKRPRLCHFVVP